MLGRTGVCMWLLFLIPPAIRFLLCNIVFLLCVVFPCQDMVCATHTNNKYWERKKESANGKYPVNVSLQMSFVETCETVFVILIHLRNKRIDQNWILWLICVFTAASINNLDMSVVNVWFSVIPENQIQISKKREETNSQEWNSFLIMPV